MRRILRTDGHFEALLNPEQELTDLQLLKYHNIVDPPPIEALNAHISQQETFMAIYKAMRRKACGMKNSVVATAN